MSSFYRKAAIPVATILTAIFTQFPAHSNLVNGESKDSNQQNHEQVLLSSIVNFEPPSDNGDPNSTAAGGSRSSCPQRNSPQINTQQQNEALPLTALLPKTTNEWLTIKQRPTFFVYVPATSASNILFQLKDERDQVIYQDVIEISAQTGRVVDIKLPNKSPSLEVDKKYQWSVFLLCQYESANQQQNIDSLHTSYDLMNEPWVMANVTRISPPTTLDTNLEQNLSIDLAIEYGKKGLWFETLATLHAMIQNEPQQDQLQQVWQQLLESQGIEQEIAQAQF